MTWELVGAGLPALSVLGSGLVVFLLAGWRYQVLGNPVSAFLWSWVPMGIVLATGWVTFHTLQPTFLGLLASSMSAFLVGSLAGAHPRPPAHGPEPVPVDPHRFRLLLWGTAITGLIGFIGFVLAVRLQVGWAGLTTRPQDLRYAMGTDRFADPTKLLQYATMLLPVLVVIGREAGVRLGRGWGVGALLAVFSNLFSTGRTRVVWIVMWSGFCLILSRERQTPRRVWGVVALMMVCTLGVFAVMDVWLGKSFPTPEQSRWAPDMPESLLGLANVFYYLGTNIPYLQEVLGGPAPEPPWFSHLLLPYYKALGYLITGVPAPAEILDSYALPRLANTGTWLVQFALDAGVAGVLVFPFLIGLLAGWLVTNPAWGDADPFRLYFGGLMLFLIWIGFIGNKFLSTPTWLFTGFGLIALPWVRRHPAVATAGPDPETAGMPGTAAGPPPTEPRPARETPPGR